jgi:hypothetical protein
MSGAEATVDPIRKRTGPAAICPRPLLNSVFKAPLVRYELYKAEPAALTGTMVACVEVTAAVPTQAAAKTLAGVLTAVRTLTESGHALCLSMPTRKLLDQAKARFARLAAAQAYPLAERRLFAVHVAHGILESRLGTAIRMSKFGKNGNWNTL